MHDYETNGQKKIILKLYTVQLYNVHAIIHGKKNNNNNMMLSRCDARTTKKSILLIFTRWLDVCACVLMCLCSSSTERSIFFLHIGDAWRCLSFSSLIWIFVEMHAFERTQYTLTIHTVQMYKHIKLVNNMPFGFLNSFFFVQKKKKKKNVHK